MSKKSFCRFALCLALFLAFILGKMRKKILTQGTYIPGDLEKSAWDISYSPMKLAQKGMDPCQIGWPTSDECSEVQEGGVLKTERKTIQKVAEKALREENSCRFTFQKCSFGSVGPHSLGRCAVVGLSDSLGNQGSEIDSYDTVFRIGFLPIERYKLRAGLKTNFTICRGYQKEIKSCFLPMPMDVYGRSPTLNLYPTGEYGKIIALKSLQNLDDHSIDIISSSSSERRSALVSTKIKLPFESLSNGYRRSSGFALVYFILSSKICTGVTVFGFSRERRSTHYFNDIEGGMRRNAPVDASHSPRFETQLYEFLGVEVA